MAESELFALLEIMLRTFAAGPPVNIPTEPLEKPGGHPSDIFLDLPEDERDEFECNICYEILKDVRQCDNKHTFCRTCILYWSTSNTTYNHRRCPVCRAPGTYVRNRELNERINNLRVKCSLKTCKWKGILKFLEAHDHTEIEPIEPPLPTVATAKVTENTTGSTPSDLPTPRGNATGATPRNRFQRSTSQSTQSSSSQPSTEQSRNNTISQRQPLGNNSSNNANANNQTRPTTLSRRNSNTSNQDNSGNTTNRSRTRSRTRSNAPSQRRTGVSAVTGLPSNTRLTSRARIRNGVSDNNSNNAAVTQGQQRVNQTPRSNENVDPSVQTTTDVLASPHPPTTPRPSGQRTARRLPTLPGLVNINLRSSAETQTTTSHNPVDNNNNVSQTSPPTNSVSAQTPAETPRREIPPESYLSRRNAQRSFGTIRERLNESRHRLDMLMQAFSGELDRGRQDLTEFQLERERRRQEQMAEVRDLGRRLSHVATELRGLLSQRRQIRSQIDTLVDAAADDD